MKTDREIMQMALHTLEDIFGKDKVDVGIITALRERLAQPENHFGESDKMVQDPVTWRDAALRVGEELSSVGPVGYYDMTAQQWLEWALHSLSQPEQEPVAWLFQHEETGLTECVDSQQVEWGFEKNNPRWQKIAPLYTAPPAREWQGLTDEEIDAAWRSVDHTQPYEQFRMAVGRAIETKLKERNG